MNSFSQRFLMSSGSALLILVYYPFAMNYVSFDIKMFVAASIGATVASIVSGAICSILTKKNMAVLILGTQLFAITLVTVVTRFIF